MRYNNLLVPAAKALGGLYYTYALRGDGQQPLRPVPESEQERAMQALLRTLHPSELTLPDNVLELIPPRPAGYGLHRELFRRYTGLVFDAISPAVVAADNTVVMILQPERAARLVQQEARDHTLPGLGDVIRELVEATFEADVDNTSPGSPKAPSEVPSTKNSNPPRLPVVSLRSPRSGTW